MQEKTDAYEQVKHHIAKGNLKGKIDQSYTVEQIEPAENRDWEGGRKGKVIKVPSNLEQLRLWCKYQTS